MHAYGLIPARLESKRLPRKLLLDRTGFPLIQHTWNSARKACKLVGIAVATDSPEIAACVEAFGGRAVLTGQHGSGTDRIAEAVERHLPDAEIIVNIQGDEPEIDPSHIDLVIDLLTVHEDAEITTLATPIRDTKDLADPSCVKVVVTPEGRALYFSRLPIPFMRDGLPQDVLSTETPWLRHIGLYAFRRRALLRFTQLPASRYEELERLEQLRALEAGLGVHVGIAEESAPGIDTPEDYARFVARWCKSSER